MTTALRPDTYADLVDGVFHYGHLKNGTMEITHKRWPFYDQLRCKLETGTLMEVLCEMGSGFAKGNKGNNYLFFNPDYETHKEISCLMGKCVAQWAPFVFKFLVDEDRYELWEREKVAPRTSKMFPVCRFDDDRGKDLVSLLSCAETAEIFVPYTRNGPFEPQGETHIFYYNSGELRFKFGAIMRSTLVGGLSKRMDYLSAFASPIGSQWHIE